MDSNTCVRKALYESFKMVLTLTSFRLPDNARSAMALMIYTVFLPLRVLLPEKKTIQSENNAETIII